VGKGYRAVPYRRRDAAGRLNHGRGLAGGWLVVSFVVFGVLFFASNSFQSERKAEMGALKTERLTEHGAKKKMDGQKIEVGTKIDVSTATTTIAFF
jgi:hypothetical protein